MLIREVKKQPIAMCVEFEGTIVSCKAPVLDGGRYIQIVQLADSSGKIWAMFTLGTKYSPLRNGFNIIIKAAKYLEKEPDSVLRIDAYTIPTKSEPEPNSPYEYSPAHPADDMTKDDWAAKDERMARMCSLNNATAIVTCFAEILGKGSRIEAAGKINVEHIKEVACKFLDWIYERKE